MVLEYTDINLFKKLYRWQYENEGIAAQLAEIEKLILNDKEDINKSEYKEWGKPEIKRWISVEPTDLSKIDLRQYFYLSRESVREKEISMLNIGLEERKIINEICSDGIDITVKRRKIQELTKLQPNKAKVVVDGIISKYRQDKSKYSELMISIIENLPDYRVKAVAELKSMREQEIDPSLIILVKSLEGKMQREYEELRECFTKHSKIAKMWNLA